MEARNRGAFEILDGTTQILFLRPEHQQETTRLSPTSSNTEEIPEYSGQQDLHTAAIEAAIALALQEDDDKSMMTADEALARALQAEEDGKCVSEDIDDDVNEAMSLSLQDGAGDQIMEMDEALAVVIQAEEGGQNLDNDLNEATGMALQEGTEDQMIEMDEALAVVLQAEEGGQTMNSSCSEKAWNFVSKVLEEHKKLQFITCQTIAPIGVDDLLIAVERFAQVQTTFRYQGKPTHVDVGYHYTRSENLNNIKQNGLLSKRERQAIGVDGNYNGSSWGDGIYTANNPTSFRYYGDVGLLVVRLKGTQKPAVRHAMHFDGDSAIVNKDSSSEMVILSQSNQCVNLIQFPTSSSGTLALFEYHCRIQQIVDEFFNDGMCTPVLKPAPPPPIMIRMQKGRLVRDLGPRERDTDPPRQLICSSFRTETYVRAPDVRDDFVGTTRGLCESMRVQSYHKNVLSCDSFDTLVVTYAFYPTDCGYTCLHKVAFLPDTPQCRGILERLKFAFCSGLIDPLLWEMIPHRTNPYSPYPEYVSVCNEVLDYMGVPKAEKCDSSSNRAQEKMGLSKEELATQNIIYPQLKHRGLLQLFKSKPERIIALRYGASGISP